MGPTTPTPDQDLPPAFGVQFHGTWEMYWNATTPNAMFVSQLDALAQAGVALIRVDVGWSASQPTNTTPSLDNTYNQRLAITLRSARERGLDVLLTLHQSPGWARLDPQGSVHQFPADPANITPWATWMAATFGNEVAAWEVWNEPNLAEFTGVTDASERARRYVPLLQATTTGLRAGHPGAVIVFGGPAQTDDGFIRMAYAAGAQPYFDVMALHPYQGNQTKPPESTDLDTPARITHLPAVLRVMAEYGDGHKPVWWTEFGYSVHSNADVPSNQPWRLGVADNATSADYLRRQFELARTRYPQVRVAIVYTSYKPPSDSLGHQYGYRIIEADGQPLPQLTELAAYCRQFPSARAYW